MTVAATTENSGRSNGRVGRVENLRPWKPGQSGNPGGKPKAVEQVRRLAQKNSTEALNKIITLMESKDERVAYMAATKIIEIAGITPKQLEDDSKSKSASVTVNIVRYDGNDNAAPQLDASPVSVRTLGSA